MVDVTLHDVLARVAVVLGEIPGLHVHWPPPEIVSQFPAVVPMPTEWEITMAANEVLNDHFDIYVMVERDNLETRIPDLLPIREEIIAKVRTNITLGYLVNIWTLLGGRFTQLQYNGQAYVGMRLRNRVQYVRRVELTDGD